MEADTYQVTVEPGITITAPRTTSRDIRRHKASNYDQAASARNDKPRANWLFCHAGIMDDLDLLRHEFNAEEGSFLLQLRIDLLWNRHAFSQLEQAMRRVCAQQESREQLDRWLAEGYWYLSDFVPATSATPTFPGTRQLSTTRQRSGDSGTCKTGSSPAAHLTWPATTGQTSRTSQQSTSAGTKT